MLNNLLHRKSTAKTMEDTYKLGKLLGKGNYSEVRLAMNVVDKNMYAVKVMTKSKLTKEDKAALEIEVKVLQELKHPNVLEFVAFYDEPKFFYIVTEVMGGGELFDRIVKKEFYSEEDAQSVVKTIAATLLYMHERGIVHRDLKPENVLLKDKSDDAVLKIADFGFATHVPKDGCRTTCGTPGYVAPEVISGKRYRLTPDAWSFGVIFYILLCGYPPFYDANQTQLFKTIRAGKYQFDSPYWDPISKHAKDLISKCLTVDENKRYTMANVLADPWVTGAAAKKKIETNRLAVFNAKRKLKSALIAAIAANRLIDLVDKVKV